MKNTIDNNNQLPIIDKTSNTILKRNMIIDEFLYNLENKSKKKKCDSKNSDEDDDFDDLLKNVKPIKKKVINMLSRKDVKIKRPKFIGKNNKFNSLLFSSQNNNNTNQENYLSDVPAEKKEYLNRNKYNEIKNKTNNNINSKSSKEMLNDYLDRIRKNINSLKISNFEKNKAKNINYRKIISTNHNYISRIPSKNKKKAYNENVKNQNFMTINKKIINNYNSFINEFTSITGLSNKNSKKKLINQDFNSINQINRKKYISPNYLAAKLYLNNSLFPNNRRRYFASKLKKNMNSKLLYFEKYKSIDKKRAFYSIISNRHNLGIKKIEFRRSHFDFEKIKKNASCRKVLL